MISVVTPTYNTPPEILARTWASLKKQSHTDWEWVIYDDSPGLATWQHIYGLCSDERYKINAIRPDSPSGGNIGFVKHQAFMAANGDILVELDHDDELTPDALAEIQRTFDSNSKIGFVWSDCCELLADGQSGRYPEGWGLGYGSDYWDEHHNVWAMRVPINRTTLGHIVSVPNHVRAWRADTYRELGGHNIELPIADDYELIVRTALKTQCVHIPKMLYKQHIGPNTAQRQRNNLIQELVSKISKDYAEEINIKYPD